MLKLGRIDFVGDIGYIVRWLPRVNPLPAFVGSDRNAFVAFPYLGPGDVPIITPLVAPSTKVAALLPAINFDPPEDHPDGQDFKWTPLLLNDFGDVNDDVGTVAGVETGSHFQRLLKWQPRVDPERTSLVAIVEPGSYRRTVISEPGALPLLAESLVKSGYDAIAIRANAEDDAEFHDVAGYAAELQRVSGLPIMHVSKNLRDLSGTSFVLGILGE